MKKKLVFAHYLPVGGAKRSFYSFLPLLAKTFDITVHEFEEENNLTLDLAHFTDIKRVKYKCPKLFFTMALRIPFVGSVIKYRVLKQAYHRMAVAINKEAPDCVLVSHCRYFQSPQLIRMLQVPVVYFCHEPPRGLYEPFIQRPYIRKAGVALKTFRVLNAMFLRYLDQREVKAAVDLFANSYYSAEVLYRVYGRKATTAQMGVDTNIFFPRKTTKENFVLSIGSLIPFKAHDFAIKCLACLPKTNRPKLILTTPDNSQTSPEKKFLENFAIQLGVEIEFHKVSDDKLAEFYSASLCTICTPHLEPAGLVCLESMACGAPVLAVAEGGLRETVVHEKTGFLLPWEPEEFAAALTRLITKPDLRNEMGQNGVDWVNKHFTWERCADTVSNALEKIISERKHINY